MTARSILQRRVRRTMLPVHIGLAWFVVFGIILGGAIQVQVMLWIGVVGFAVAFVGIWWAMLSINCPACSGRLSQLILGQGGFASVHERIRFCPYCGLRFDEEFPSPDQNAA